MLIAIAECVQRDLNETQILYFGPTMEAVVQTQLIFDAITKHMSITSHSVYHKRPLLDNVKSAVIFGTPLELVSGIQKGHVILDSIAMLAFDDADLTMNFADIERNLISMLPAVKVMAASSSYVELPNAQALRVPRTTILNQNIQHFSLKIEHFVDKLKFIAEAIITIDGQVLVFCSVSGF